ncbi:hypothetical protein H0H81_007262 [Sphagnurus paluster]|uniref:XPG-I domain-containing protein n=1 Tax=Sphagnurus paluster TaxID=117069 RepID=A0A9P7GM53_9AGAR|nr:hypothetical protein H0H81_007262 [Sphagnurus paluster]
MGVAGLWDVLRPAGKTRSLTDISVTEGFEANPDGVRGFRIGIDASIWFFHAEYGKEGENPVLRTLFFRCATLMHSPFLPLFVFDGPKRPDWKRGKKINKTSNKLIPGMKAIVESFGFEWRTAPGEAEAELAYLNRIGVIDGILSDDVDNFLFGATTVIRNPSHNLSGNRANPAVNAAGKDDKNHTKVYRLADITAHPDIRLTRGGMILIGLMSGGDYHQGGLSRCGTVTSHGLAKCGFGDTLVEAASKMNRAELKVFLVAWRHELCHELRTNSQGHIGRKQVALANSVPAEFPDIDVLLSYTNPITSESMGRAENNSRLTWGKEPDLGKLAGTCEFYFEWGYREAIIKRFRTVIWHAAVLRILRRAVLDLDAKEKSKSKSTLPLPPTTPRKAGKATREPIGTPSKMIAKHFSNMTLGDGDSDSDDETDPLIVKIHSERKHVSTDGILEYRLEIAPAQLVRMAESGIKGTRAPEGPDEWADSDDEDDGKGAKKPPPDPDSHLRVWMPACMVRLVEPRLVAEYDVVQERKQAKKAGKGKGRSKKKVVSEEDDSCSDKDALPRPAAKAPPTKTKTKRPPKDSASSDLDDDVVVPKPKPKTVPKPVTKATSKFPWILEDEVDPPEPEVAPPQVIVRDLTKKKVSSGKDIKSFFPTSKPSNVLSNTTKSSSVLTALDATRKPGRQEINSSEDGPSARRPTKTKNSISRQDSAPKAQPVVRDLTKKKPVTTAVDSTIPKRIREQFSDSNAAASSSSGRTATENTPSDEDFDSLKELLVSPKKPDPLASWKNAPHSKYISISDSEDDAAHTDGNRAFLDDGHMFDSDEDPFSAAPRASPKHTRKHIPKSRAPPAGSDSDSVLLHVHKSPRKSAQHTSPRKHPPVSSARDARPTSPSPAKPRQLLKAKPPGHGASRAPGKVPLPVIEISSDSGSDSDDSLPPVPRIDVPPLMLARARVGGPVSADPKPALKNMAKASIPAKTKLPRKAPTTIIHDIIDLT